MSLPTALTAPRRRRTVLDLLSEDLPPRFFPIGTPWLFGEKGRCHWCGMKVAPPRISWCSQACVDEWTVRSSGSWVRPLVWTRDHGVCASCGLDTAEERRTQYGDRWVDVWGLDAPWDADHIVPVWRGGGLCGLEGYQTLCKVCHAVKTAADAAERAALRRPEPVPSPQLALAL